MMRERQGNLTPLLLLYATTTTTSV